MTTPLRVRTRYHDLENNNVFVLQKIGFPGFVGNRNSNWDFYIQDDWKVNRRLTLNLGLRYDYNTVWTAGANQGQNFDVATQSLLPINQKAYHAPKGDWAPRVGFAWDPNGQGKTVVHGYVGLFYNPMHFNFATTTNVPALASYNVNVFQAIFANPPFSINYPSPNPPLIAGIQNVNAFPQNPKDPVATNWLFDVQQEVARNTILTLSYVGNNVHHMQAGVDFAALNANPANVFTQARQYPNFANENILSDGLGSNYNSLQVKVIRKVGKLDLQANYTWSHEIDDMLNVFSPGFESPYTPNYDRASGDWDVRHNFTGSALYSLPDLKGSTSLRSDSAGRVADVRYYPDTIGTSSEHFAGRRIFWQCCAARLRVRSSPYWFRATVGQVRAITSTPLPSNRRTTGHRVQQSELSDATLCEARRTSSSTSPE